MTNPAPVVQLVLTVQFQPPAASLTMVDWAEIRAAFVSDYPIFQQVVRAGPMSFDQPQFVFSGSELPRLALHSEDLTWVIYMQDDRVSFGWNRQADLDSDPSYPGFDAIVTRALSVMRQAFDLISQRSNLDLDFSVGEVIYADAFILQKEGRQARRLDEVFHLAPNSNTYTFQQFTMNFNSTLSVELGDSFEGSLQNIISGPSVGPTGEALVHLQTVVRCKLEGVDEGGFEEPFSLAHEVALKAFSALVKPDPAAILA